MLVGGWRMDGGSGEREKGGSGESQLCKRYVCVCYPHYLFLQRILGGGGTGGSRISLQNVPGPQSLYLEISETQIEVIEMVHTNNYFTALIIGNK